MPENIYFLKKISTCIIQCTQLSFVRMQVWLEFTWDIFVCICFVDCHNIVSRWSVGASASYGEMETRPKPLAYDERARGNNPKVNGKHLTAVSLHGYLRPGEGAEEYRFHSYGEHAYTRVLRLCVHSKRSAWKQKDM